VVSNNRTVDERLTSGPNYKSRQRAEMDSLSKIPACLGQRCRDPVVTGRSPFAPRSE